MITPKSNVLVVNIARLGDTLLATPALRAIKSACPQGRLGCLAHPKARAILDGLPFVDKLGAITPKTAWWRDRLDRQRWDVALVYGKEAPLIRYAARVSNYVVAHRHSDPSVNRLIDQEVPTPTEPLHCVHDRLLLPAALGIRATDLRLSYYCSPTERKHAANWITKNGLESSLLVGFLVAGFPTRAFRDWPLESFLDLGRRILSAYPDAHILVIGADESREKASELVAQLGSRVTSMAGRMDIRESAALMESLALYVGTDTGPTHLAGALGIPMVGIYHCRTPARLVAPINHPFLRAVAHPIADADCPRTTPMSDISVESVWSAAKELLDTSQKSRADQNELHNNRQETGYAGQNEAADQN